MITPGALKRGIGLSLGKIQTDMNSGYCACAYGTLLCGMHTSVLRILQLLGALNIWNRVAEVSHN